MAYGSWNSGNHNTVPDLSCTTLYCDPAGQTSSFALALASNRAWSFVSIHGCKQVGESWTFLWVFMPHVGQLQAIELVNGRIRQLRAQSVLHVLHEREERRMAFLLLSVKRALACEQ